MNTCFVHGISISQLPVDGDRTAGELQIVFLTYDFSKSISLLGLEIFLIERDSLGFRTNE